MKKNLFFAVIAALTLSLSCAKENESDLNPVGSDSDFVTVTLTAGTEGTKTTLGDVVDGMRAISWNEGDEIKVVYGEGAHDYALAQAKSSGLSTEFTISVPKDATTLYAVYPADACQSVFDGNIVVNVPSLQDGVFASANIAVARTTVAEHQLAFRNVVSYVLTDITDESVRGVRLEGEGLALAGDVPVSFTEAGEVELGQVANPSDEVFTTVKGTGTCYIALAAGVSFNDGVKITFTDGEGAMLSDLTVKKADFVLERAAVLDAGALDAAGVISYFVTPSGNGTKDGLSSANAWSVEEFAEWLATENPEVPAGKIEAAPFNIYLADGKYTIPAAVAVPAKDRVVNIVSPGQGAVIDGSAVETRLLDFKGSGKITITGVTFSGHAAKSTSQVILWFSKPTEGTQEVHLTDCVFTENTNTAVGAGLVLNNGGENYVTDCEFTKNVSGGAPALNIDNADTKVTLEGCTFSDNECVSYSNSQNSGAIKVGNGTVTVSDCIFENNKISVASGAGAAVWVDNCKKVTFNKGCLFKGNTSVGDGGAVFVNRGEFIEFDACDFQENSADGYGGAVCLGSSAVHTNGDFNVVFKNGTTFTSNTAVNGGGAIMVVKAAAGTFSTDGCTFTGNKVTGTSGGKGGGAIRIDQDFGNKVTFANTTFASNSAYRHGGAVAVYRDTDLDVNHCIFTENKLTLGRGGAIYIGGDSDCDNNVHIFGNTIFTSNSGHDSGGAVAVTNDGNGKVSSDSEDYLTCRSIITIENTSFVTNTSLARGGALDLKTSGTVTVRGCLFDGNYTTNENANGCGAGINIEYGNTFQKYPDLRGQVNISECRFIGNHTKHTFSGASFDPRGGAIAIPGAGGALANNVDVRVDKCYFKDNVARQAAAIRAYSGKTGDISLFVNACSFEGNYTYGNNGACIFVYKSKEFGMNNCSFRNNYRVTSGAISGLAWINVTTTPTVMSNNTIVGQLQYKSGDVSDYAAGGGLVRLENAGVTTLVNNMIASTKTWCAPIYLSGEAQGEINTYSNKLSQHSVTVTASDSFNGTDWIGTSSYFGSLAWTANTTAGQEYKSGWIWDGALATGTPATKNALSDVNNKIKAANEAFHTWLGSVGGLDKDQAGNARGAETWPGAYQKQ